MKIKFFVVIVLLITILLGCQDSSNKTPAIKATGNIVKQTLTLSYINVNVSGQIVQKIAVNGTIPGPVLSFMAGDTAEITVINNLPDAASIHWHGLLVPLSQDGVDGIGGFKNMQPNTSFTYQFAINQAGTYWYHSHVGGQTQEGMYGAFIVQDPFEKFKYNKEATLLLSDMHVKNAKKLLTDLQSGIMGHSNSMGANHAMPDGTVMQGMDHSNMTMNHGNTSNTIPAIVKKGDVMEINDIANMVFMVNGENRFKTVFKAGEIYRIRIINGSATSFFDINMPNINLQVISADGMLVKPVDVEELRIGPGETYDVLAILRENKPYLFLAESLDRSGFAVAHFVNDIAQKVEENLQSRPPVLVEHETQLSSSASSGDWANKNVNALKYSMLSNYYSSTNNKATRTINVDLNGSMMPYAWTIGSSEINNSNPITLKKGETVEIVLNNISSMPHAIHLHGNYFKLINGKKASDMPLKHTVNVAPKTSYSILFTAKEEGDWAFHCHMLYHMEAGMMSFLSVIKS